MEKCPDGGSMPVVVYCLWGKGGIMFSCPLTKLCQWCLLEGIKKKNKMEISKHWILWTSGWSASHTSYYYHHWLHGILLPSDYEQFLGHPTASLRQQVIRVRGWMEQNERRGRECVCVRRDGRRENSEIECVVHKTDEASSLYAKARVKIHWVYKTLRTPALSLT